MKSKEKELLSTTKPVNHIHYVPRMKKHYQIVNQIYVTN